MWRSSPLRVPVTVEAAGPAEGRPARAVPRRTDQQVHLAADRRCRPMTLVLTAGQAGGSPQFISVLEKVRVRLPVGRPHTQPDAKAGNTAYSPRANRAHLRKRCIKAVIQEKGDQAAHRKKKGSLGGQPVLSGCGWEHRQLVRHPGVGRRRPVCGRGGEHRQLVGDPGVDAVVGGVVVHEAVAGVDGGGSGGGVPGRGGRCRGGTGRHQCACDGCGGNAGGCDVPHQFLHGLFSLLGPSFGIRLGPDEVAHRVPASMRRLTFSSVPGTLFAFHRKGDASGRLRRRSGDAGAGGLVWLSSSVSLWPGLASARCAFLTRVLRRPRGRDHLAPVGSSHPHGWAGVSRHVVIGCPAGLARRGPAPPSGSFDCLGWVRWVVARVRVGVTRTVGDCCGGWCLSPAPSRHGRVELGERGVRGAAFGAGLVGTVLQGHVTDVGAVARPEGEVVHPAGQRAGRRMRREAACAGRCAAGHRGGRCCGAGCARRRG